MSYNIEIKCNMEFINDYKLEIVEYTKQMNESMQGFYRNIFDNPEIADGYIKMVNGIKAKIKEIKDRIAVCQTKLKL